MKALELKGTAVKHAQMCVHVCDCIQVCVKVTVSEDLAPLGYDDTLGCGHNLCRSTETGICGCLSLAFQVPRLSIQVVGGGMWDHWGVWACVKAPDAQVVYVLGFLNRTGMCKCETAHFPGPALVHGQTVQHLCWGQKCLSCVPERAP